MSYVAIKPVGMFTVHDRSGCITVGCPACAARCEVVVPPVAVLAAPSPIALASLIVSHEQLAYEGLHAVGCIHVAEAPRGWWDNGVA